MPDVRSQPGCSSHALFITRQDGERGLAGRDYGISWSQGVLDIPVIASEKSFRHRGKCSRDRCDGVAIRARLRATLDSQDVMSFFHDGRCRRGQILRRPLS
jgi:hypothetical protein